MKAKQLLENYIIALDRYREDPNRHYKDLLFEAEYEIREKLNMPTDYLEEYYRVNR